MPHRLLAEELAERISNMEYEGLVRTLRKMQCDFEMDFTDEFLKSLSLGHLRHLVLASALHNHAEAAGP